MVTGARTLGAVSAPAGPVPRLFQSERSPAMPAVGLVFVPLIHDTSSIRTDPADVSGVASAMFGPVPSDQVYLVERITVASESTDPTSLRVYLGAVDPENIVEATGSGNSDVADEVQPVLVPGGQSLIFQWTGVTAGARSFARLQGQFGRYQQAAI